MPGGDPVMSDAKPAADSSVTVPLIEGIEIEIAAAPGGGWITRFARNGDTLTEDRNSTEPWIDRRAPGRLTKALAEAAPTLKEKAIKEAITAVFDGIRESPDGAALISEPAARVINATERVEREMSDPPAYAVYLDNGDCLEFSNRDLAAAQPITLNERWQAIRFEPLRATRRDFEEIIDHWFSMAVPVDPPGAKSPWERIAEKLETRIAPLPRETDRSALKKHGIWQDPEPDGLLWVRSDLIQEVITEAGENPNDGRFARYLEREKILIERSKKIRVPGAGVPPRAWGLAPEFKIDLDDAPGGSLTEDPVGD